MTRNKNAALWKDGQSWGAELITFNTLVRVKHFLCKIHKSMSALGCINTLVRVVEGIEVSICSHEVMINWAMTLIWYGTLKH